MNGKKRITAMVLLLWTIAVVAQTDLSVVTGVVKDRETKALLRQANISVPGSNVSTVTNDDGRFIIKSATPIERIMVSHLGYRSRYVKVNSGSKDITVMMQPSSIMLSEVFVAPDDPVEILATALSKIPDNFGKENRMMQAFYRETVQKRNRFIYIAEAVADLVKTGYHRSISGDRVVITKGRRLLSQRQTDTLGVKIMGGPALGMYLDLVKNRDFLLNDVELSHYELRMADAVKIEDRLQCVIELVPAAFSLPYALYHGRLYIDYETFTFTRIELELDMIDKEKATQLMLVRKPLGVKFKPKEMKSLITFKTENGLSRLNYIRTEMRFNCDWKRRFFSNSFRSVTEMVITDVYQEPKALKGASSFSTRESFYDKVMFFDDPDFWKDYNIIEPTESLENAIGKLKKNAQAK